MRRRTREAVARRIIEGHPRRSLWPPPIIQMVIWGYVLALVLWLAWRHERRLAAPVAPRELVR